MSLKIFHVIFVTLSVLLSLGFSKWCWQNGFFIGTPVAFGFAVLLLVYGVWFWKKLQNIKLS